MKKYRNSSGNCLHKKNTHLHQKEKMPCIEKGCPYKDECIIEEKSPKEQARVFFEERFGNKKSKTDGYFDGWVEHFKTGHPETFMDGWSKAIYMRLIREKKI